MPLQPGAADALRECIEATRARSQRPLVDEATGRPTYYVFQLRGKLMSTYRLFHAALSPPANTPACYAPTVHVP